MKKELSTIKYSDINERIFHYLNGIKNAEDSLRSTIEDLSFLIKNATNPQAITLLKESKRGFETMLYSFTEMTKLFCKMEYPDESKAVKQIDSSINVVFSTINASKKHIDKMKNQLGGYNDF